MFLYQDTEEAKERNRFFYKAEKEWLLENNKKKGKNDYISKHYYQYLTNLVQDKTEDEDIKKLFSIGCDILTRHVMTKRSFINYNDDTKNEFYTYALFRIFNYALKTYDREKSSAFIYMTSAITNGIKQVIKDDTKQLKLSRKKLEKDGIEGYIGNLNHKITNELESDYLPNMKEEDFNTSTPLFIQELKAKYKDIKKIRILNEDNVPRFKRSYTEFNYFIPVTKVDENIKGICIEYIDIYKNNEESEGYSKSYYLNKMKKARENGHQTFFLFSDLYNDENIDDKILFDKLDDIIKGIKEDLNYVVGSYIDNGKIVSDPMISYIPEDIFNNMKLSEQIWYWLEEDRKNRKLPLSQSEDEYKDLKIKNENGTRIWNCGSLIL